MKKYREAFTFPDSSRAIAFGDAYTVQINYIGKGPKWAEQLMETVKHEITRLHGGKAI